MSEIGCNENQTAESEQSSPGRLRNRDGPIAEDFPFIRVLAARYNQYANDHKMYLGWVIAPISERKQCLIYLDGGEADWFGMDSIRILPTSWTNKGLESCFQNKKINAQRQQFNFAQLRCLMVIMGDEKHDMVSHKSSIGQVLLLADEKPVQIVARSYPINLKVRNLLDNEEYWLPYFSINFERNRNYYQTIIEDKNLFKDFTPLMPLSNIGILPDVEVPMGVHKSLVGDWNPRLNILGMVDNIEPLPEREVIISDVQGLKRVLEENCSQQSQTYESTASKISKLNLQDSSSGIDTIDTLSSEEYPDEV